MEPFYAFRLRIGPVPTTALEVVLGVGLGAGLLAAGGSLPWRSSYGGAGLLLLLAAAIEIGFAPDRRAALGIWKAFFLEPVLAFLVIAWLTNGRRRATLFLGALGVAGLLLAAAEWLAFGQQLSGAGYDVVHPPKPFFLMTPNAVALFLLPLDAFALAIAAFSDSSRERISAGLFAAVTVAAVVMSGSRGGEVALLAIVAGVGAFHPLRLRLIGGASLLALVAVGVSRQVRQRILVELRPGDPNNTVNLRLPLWQSTLRMLRAHPLVGGGLDGFHAAVQPYKVAGFIERDVNYPHDFVLTFWSETGLLGLVAFLWLLVQAVRTALTGLRSEPWVRTLSIGLLGALLAVVVHGLVDVPYFKNDLALELWGLLGIQYGSLASARRRSGG